MGMGGRNERRSNKVDFRAFDANEASLVEFRSLTAKTYMFDFANNVSYRCAMIQTSVNGIRLCLRL